MTYAEYLRGLLESFPGYVEKSQPNEPPYLCMVGRFVVIPICIVVVVWLLSRW